jgi:hypothetical protein
MSLLSDFNRTQTKGNWRTEGKDVQFRIEADADEIAIIFQQTVSESDWAFNFKALPVVYKDSPVPFAAHEGFVSLWKSVRPIVMGEVAALYGANPHRSVNVIGFSQGAALALLCYEDIAYSLKPSYLHGYGFGCPRVIIGEEISNRFAHFHRITVRGDLVTELPPWVMGYRHMGRLTAIGPVALPWPSNHEPKIYRKYLADL